MTNKIEKIDCKIPMYTPGNAEVGIGFAETRVKINELIDVINDLQNKEKHETCPRCPSRNCCTKDKCFMQDMFGGDNR